MMLHKGVFILYLSIINLLMIFKITNIHIVCSSHDDFAKFIIHYSRRFKLERDPQPTLHIPLKLLY